MNYAIIKASGSQYLVSPGDSLELPNLSLKDGDKIVFSEVLLGNIDGKIQIGSPYVSGLQISGVVKKNFKGEKVDIFKFKAKSRYRRHMGFRPQLTLVEIENFGGVSKPEIKSSEKPKVRKVTTKKKAVL